MLPTSCALNVPASASARPASSIIKPAPGSHFLSSTPTRVHSYESRER